MSDVAKMKERIAEIDEIVRPLELEKATLEQAVLEAGSMFQVGDVIEWRRGRKIARGKVTGVRPYVATSLYYTDAYMEKMKQALAGHTHSFQNGKCTVCGWFRGEFKVEDSEQASSFEWSVDARLDRIESTLKLASKNQDTIFSLIMLLLFVSMTSLGLLALMLVQKG